MKCDVGKEVSKQSVVSRKLLDFHSFSKGLETPPELMSTLCSAGEGAELPQEPSVLPPPLAGLCLPRAASRQMEQRRDAAKPSLGSRFSSLAVRARRRASAFISELCAGRALPGLELKVEIRAGAGAQAGPWHMRCCSQLSCCSVPSSSVSKGPERRQGSFPWGLSLIPRVLPRFH